MYPFELKYSRMELYTLLRFDENIFNALVDSQIDITLAVTQFRIFKRVVSYAVFVFNNRQWFDRFGGYRQLLCMDTDFAHLCAEYEAFDSDEVA